MMFGRRNGTTNRPIRANDGPHLTNDELQEFCRRYTALEAAKANYVMLDESWRGWVSQIGVKYGVGTLFDVDSTTGALRARERPPTEAGT